jgi:hypothetical protein
MKFLKDIKKALSDTEIKKAFGGKVKIVKYADIRKMNNIDELLQPYGRTVILFETKPNYGHYTCIMYIYPKNKQKILFHDSYGMFPENQLNYIPYSMKNMTNQERNYLLELLYNQPLDIHYNTYRLQKLENGVNTCGRHCIIRMSDDTLDENQFNKVMRETEYNPDELSVVLTKDYI